MHGGTWQDLRQEGAFGLIKAIARFDPLKGTPFRSFAKYHIRGAIFASPDIPRDLARRQRENYRKVRKAEDELVQTLQRHPTIEEVAKHAQLTMTQILDAIDARDITFAVERCRKPNMCRHRWCWNYRSKNADETTQSCDKLSSE